jgi:GH18 family chitinase
MKLSDDFDNNQLTRKSCVVLVHTSSLWSHKEKKEKREKREKMEKREEKREKEKTCVCDQIKILWSWSTQVFLSTNMIRSIFLKVMMIVSSRNSTFVV